MRDGRVSSPLVRLLASEGEALAECPLPCLNDPRHRPLLGLSFLKPQPRRPKGPSLAEDNPVLDTVD